MKSGKYIVLIVSVLILAFASSCEPLPKYPAHLPKLVADLETEPVDAFSMQDAADDPAIWVDSSNVSQSTIIGTNKLRGLEVYDLQGKRLHSYKFGRLNNIDLRYGFPLNDSIRIDIVAGSERNFNQIMVFAINPQDRSLYEVSEGISTSIQEVYGFCLYYSISSDAYYAFINGKSGRIDQWKLIVLENGKVGGELVRTLDVRTQPEGMVADDKTGKLYVGEEGEGIWVFNAEPYADTKGKLIKNSGEENPNIRYDIEGLAIYDNGEKRYLLASSQGNNTYAIFNLNEDNTYLGSFAIATEKFDGVEETDGIEVSAANFGGEFSNGIFIAQDGFNLDPKGKVVAQNFKILSWKKIEALIPQSTDSAMNE